MEEDRNQEDAALSLSDGGPPKRVQDSGGLESEGLTLRNGSVLKGPTLPMSQISGLQALAESSAVTVKSQAVSSLSERESATTHTGSGSASADPSLASLPGFDKQLDVPASVSSVVTASLAMPGCIISHW